MAADDFRQWPTAESTGIDKGYKKDRGRALADLDATMAGPRQPGVAEEGVKNPEGEFQNPAPFTGSPHGGRSEGPNGAGNSSGSGDIDPQGQQGGTQGGQPARPTLPNEVHPVSSKTSGPSS